MKKQFELKEELVSISQFTEVLVNYFLTYNKWPDKIELNKHQFLVYLRLLSPEMIIKKLTFLGIPVIPKK